ncbi:MAG: hypothetical protein ACRENA_08390 [Vulcanimicrobiaceae bacterium]
MHAGSTTIAEFLRELDIVLDARNLWHFSHWITPPSENRRFDTRFYLAAAPADQIATTDEHETFGGLWISPQEALRRHADGNFPMIFPTIMHLQRLDEYRTVAELAAFAQTKEIHVVEPVASGNRDFSFHPGLESRW